MVEVFERQQYELAFHLLPSFDDRVLGEKKRGLEELISKSGGMVSRFGEIKKIRLAYPVKKELFSNFGWLEFSAPPGSLEKLNKNLFLDENFLRHLIIRKEEETAAKPFKRISLKPRPGMTEKTEKASEGEQKELDKKIEEILEKI